MISLRKNDLRIGSLGPKGEKWKHGVCFGKSPRKTNIRLVQVVYIIYIYNYTLWRIYPCIIAKCVKTPVQHDEIPCRSWSSSLVSWLLPFLHTSDVLSIREMQNQRGQRSNGFFFVFCWQWCEIFNNLLLFSSSCCSEHHVFFLKQRSLFE